MLHRASIFTCIWLQSMVNVGKYSSPMEPLGDNVILVVPVLRQHPLRGMNLRLMICLVPTKCSPHTMSGKKYYLRIYLVVSKIFYFHPYLGKIPILTNIFQRGWFNHQLVLEDGTFECAGVPSRRPSPTLFL